MTSSNVSELPTNICETSADGTPEQNPTIAPLADDVVANRLHVLMTTLATTLSDVVARDFVTRVHLKSVIYLILEEALRVRLDQLYCIHGLDNHTATSLRKRALEHTLNAVYNSEHICTRIHQHLQQVFYQHFQTVLALSQLDVSTAFGCVIRKVITNPNLSENRVAMIMTRVETGLRKYLLQGSGQSVLYNVSKQTCAALSNELDITLPTANIAKMFCDLVFPDVLRKDAHIHHGSARRPWCVMLTPQLEQQECNHAMRHLQLLHQDTAFLNQLSLCVDVFVQRVSVHVCRNMEKLFLHSFRWTYNYWKRLFEQPPKPTPAPAVKQP